MRRDEVCLGLMLCVGLTNFVFVDSIATENGEIVNLIVVPMALGFMASLVRSRRYAAILLMVVLSIGIPSVSAYFVYAHDPAALGIAVIVAAIRLAMAVGVFLILSHLWRRLRRA